MSEVHLPIHTPTVSLNASEELERTAPAWLAEVAVHTEVWKASGLLAKLQQQVHVPRGRMGSYQECDFVLVELSYAVSQELSQRALYRRLEGFGPVLAGLWGRKTMPSRFALSRFQSAIDEGGLEALRKLLFSDLLAQGIGSSSLGGLLDRDGRRHVVFDVDATRHVVRWRRLVSRKEYPPARRRLARLCAPGFTGRKRGEALRTRTTVQQAHTQEWLGTFGGAGNGQLYAELRAACETVRAYLEAHGLPPEAGLLRLDGLYGFAGIISIPCELGLGYIARCRDYSLLEQLGVPQCLAELESEEYSSLDSGTVCKLYALGWIQWSSGSGVCKPLNTRLIVSERPAPKGGQKPRVGKRIGESVYELFVTDKSSSGLSPSDVLSLYQARGGFEDSLRHEDQELEPDRWYSAHPAGQEWCQLLSQWVWNARLRLGFSASDGPQRCTLWAEAAAGSFAEPQEEPGHCLQEHGATGSEAASAREPLLEEKEASRAKTATAEPATQAEEAAPAQSQETPVEFEPQQTLPESKPPPADERPLAEKEPWDVQAARSESAPQALAEASALQTTPRPPLPSPSLAPAPPVELGEFVLLDSTTVRCPAGKLLRPSERRGLRSGELRLRFEARASECRACSLATKCRPKAKSDRKGRRVTMALEGGVPRPPEPSSHSPPQPARNSLPLSRAKLLSPATQPLGVLSLLWHDLPASQLRCFLPLLLLTLRFDLPVALLSEAPAPMPQSILTRDQRAHRRLSYQQRLDRNALPPNVLPGSIHIHGLPKPISEYLAMLGLNARAA